MTRGDRLAPLTARLSDPCGIASGVWGACCAAPGVADATRRWMVVVLMGAFLLASCGGPEPPLPESLVGLSRDEIRRLLGEPDANRDLTLTGDPFFGPQERLAGLVPPGSTVEEWQYEWGQERLYVWFYGGEASSRTDWTVILSAKVPRDAVY